MSDLMSDGPEGAPVKLILAHGAGAPMDSPFMTTFAHELGRRDIRVLRFEFPYMKERRISGRKRPPDRAPVLLDTWRSVIDASGGPSGLVIGGKSMGGRMASLIADETGVAGLVCLGYPFHAPGKADRPRTEHLAALRTPSLIVQGERDSMGNRETVSGYDLSAAISLHWLTDGDHSFKPRKASGRTEKENWMEGIDAVAEFCHKQVH